MPASASQLSQEKTKDASSGAPKFVRRVRKHHAGGLAGEHCRIVCGAGGVSTYQPVFAQQPHIAGPCDRLGRRFWDVILTGVLVRVEAVEQLVEFLLAEPDGFKIDTIIL